MDASEPKQLVFAEFTAGHALPEMAIVWLAFFI